MLTLLAILIFLLTVLILGQLAGWLFRKQKRVTGRLKLILAADQGREPAEKKKLVAPTRRLSRMLGAVSLLSQVIGRRQLEKIQTNLVKAGIPMKAEEMVTLAGVLGLLTVTFLLVVLSNNILAITIGILIGVMAPLALVSFCKRRRLKKIEDQLLDGTVLMASSLRAGHSFLQALELVGKELPQPLSEEFGRVIRETKLGTPLEEALNKLKDRLESKEVDLLVTGVLIQRQAGGNLAEILDGITDTIEKRIKTRAKISALTAQGRMSAWIVSLLPFALAFLVFGMYPDFGRVMLTDPLGLIMLAFGAVMLVIGVLVIRKVVNIDV